MAKVLLVDDEEGLRYILARELKRSGFEVTSAEDGLAACQCLQEDEFDVIVSDVKMPRMNGMQLLDFAYKNTPTTEFIILTGHGSMENAVEAFKTGHVFDYLVKPLDDIAELSVVVGRAVERRRLLMEHSQLTRDRQELVLLIENSADFIALASLELTLRYLNGAGIEMIGAESLSEAQGHRLVDFFAEENREKMAQVMANELARIGHWQGETSLRDFKTDGKILTHVNAFMVKGLGNGEPMAVALVARDIRRYKDMERQLAQAQRLESIGQLAAGIAHEINTPIQYVGDNTRFLQQTFADLAPILDACRDLAKCQNEKARLKTAQAIVDLSEKADLDYLAGEVPTAILQTLEGVDRVAQIVRAMKEFSHPGSDTHSPVDLNKAVENTLTVARTEWKYVADVVKEFDTDLPLVPCLIGELNQVFLNLIVNASQAIAQVVGDGAERKGTITITTKRAGEWVEIRIADTGAGIPEEVQAKIFDPFFTTKGVGKGTGQGLTISHAAVKRHGGTITFETKPGEGTTFIIRLPLDPAGAEPLKEAA